MLDTNVLLDILTGDARWLEWSTAQFREASKEGLIPINPIIYAELSAAFETQEELDHWLRPEIFKRLPLPFEAGFRASRAFLAYREAGGNKTSPLPDFYIGAHAEHSGYTLVTRDPKRYRTYFPEVVVISPDLD
ncbi:MAG TPA: type II toxin-antitoxin system VapC family toxin [Opitutaceae bacterium]|nr:type II toxin-antitoxin system VapC family toxin [Opitutaceae bacterium]